MEDKYWSHYSGEAFFFSLLSWLSFQVKVKGKAWEVENSMTCLMRSPSLSRRHRRRRHRHSRLLHFPLVARHSSWRALCNGTNMTGNAEPSSNPGWHLDSHLPSIIPPDLAVTEPWCRGQDSLQLFCKQTSWNRATPSCLQSIPVRVPTTESKLCQN